MLQNVTYMHLQKLHSTRNIQLIITVFPTKGIFVRLRTKLQVYNLQSCDELNKYNIK